jgi:hypothetical protein
MDISVIIPVHECNDTITPLLTTAFDSVVAQEKIEELPNIYVVYAAEIEECIVGWKDSMIRKHSSNGVNSEKIILVKNEEETDFQSQVNLGVSKVDTEFFSILELDDEYSTTYFYNMLKYIKHEDYSDVDVFLSMIIETNEKNESIKLTNEVVWAQQFVGENGEMGFLNLNSLKQYTDFKISGSVIKKEEYENIGGLKKNIKLTFNYEFLLRALNNACRIFTIPKIGYKHLSGREGSLFAGYQKTMPMNERNFWFETATRESNFTTDRVIDMSKLNKIVVEEK